jgi:proteasome accessory factor A
MRTLMGIETEYAVMAHGQPSQEISRHQFVDWLFTSAMRDLCSLPDLSAPGVYLENGSRLYLDTGSHPEFSTPECLTPRDAVRYALAGDRIMSSLLNSAARGRKSPEMAIYRSNVDYSGSKSTWGCHESYLHRSDPESLPAHVIPHLVSRIIYTGAGGFSNVSKGVDFTLSPRVPHLVRISSSESTAARGIFHTKNETLSGGRFNRMHVLCGESLCSHLGNLLKMGTTALVVLLVDAGRSPAPRVRFRNPVKAMRCFAADPSCTSAAELTSGKQVTAIEVQRVFLKAAEELVASGQAPGWSQEVCHEWRRVLEQLEQAPASIRTSLDWGIKLAIYRDRVERAGLRWGSRAMLRLRDQLLELDTRFADISPKGIFNMLDGAGVLSHQRLAPSEIQDAVYNPPQSGRARKRGGYIRQMSNERLRYRCAWQRIYDRGQKRTLNLADPFGEIAEFWEPGTGSV